MSHYKTIQALGIPHVVYQGLIDFLDDFELAAMLSHLLYWSDKTDNPLGVYRSNSEWYELYRFSDKKIKSLSDELQNRGLIKKTYKRLDHRMYYLLDVAEFDRQYEIFANRQNSTSPIAKTAIREEPKQRLADTQNGDSLYTKITTKNTSKITTENSNTHTNENSESENQEVQKKSSLKTKKSVIEKPDELNEQIWTDFLKVKKQRTKSELTETAWKRFFNQVMLAKEQTGHSLNDIFSFWIADVTWKGFDVNWYLNRVEQKNQQQGYFQQQGYVTQGNQRMNNLQKMYQEALAEEQQHQPQEQGHDYW